MVLEPVFCQIPAVWLDNPQEMGIISLLQMVVDQTNIFFLWKKKFDIVKFMTHDDYIFQLIFS